LTRFGDSLILGSSPEEGVLMGRPSKYSPEFREQAVELVRATGRPVSQVARDLQINDTTLGNWVNSNSCDQGASRLRERLYGSRLIAPERHLGVRRATAPNRQALPAAA
jgi:transposase-like protein